MILGFCTSGPYCGVALWHDGDVVSAAHEEMARGQGERLFPLIGSVLDEAGATLEGLDALGVGIGPGNFTGIRISVAAARGLALGLGIPAVGVSLLEALAWGTAGPVLASVSAGRGHLVLQRFGAGAERGPETIAEDDVAGWAWPGLTCIGNREAEIAARLGAAPGPAAYYPASAIARIAATRGGEGPSRPVPMYLRPADAAPASDPPPAIL